MQLDAAQQRFSLCSQPFATEPRKASSQRPHTPCVLLCTLWLQSKQQGIQGSAVMPACDALADAKTVALITLLLKHTVRRICAPLTLLHSYFLVIITHVPWALPVTIDYCTSHTDCSAYRILLQREKHSGCVCSARFTHPLLVFIHQPPHPRQDATCALAGKKTASRTGCVLSA